MNGDMVHSESVDVDETVVGAPRDVARAAVDPRTLLAVWANERDEWVRSLVGEIIQSGAPVSESQIAGAYELFRQEKGLDVRTLEIVEPLSVDATTDETAPPLTISRLSEVESVNALVPGSVIEPHAGLTIIYGENGTGKTGYARIFKALAKSRTDGDILGDVSAGATGTPSAKISYTLGDGDKEFHWGGEHGVAPFVRMSIFDAPSVSYHVDADLEYVYVPAALALFNHASAAIRGMQTRLEDRIASLQSGSSVLLDRFPRESSVYAQIETLGAATDLAALKAKADPDPAIEDRLGALRQAVAALESDSLPTQIRSRQREVRVLTQANDMASALLAVDPARYNELLGRRTQLTADYETFRSTLFAAASLPAEPEETWTSFIEAGEAYRRHLAGAGVHDADRCLYCRQQLDSSARELLDKYSSYLEDKISADLRKVGGELRTIAENVRDLPRQDVETFLLEHESVEGKPSYYDALAVIAEARKTLYDAMTQAIAYDGDLASTITEPAAAMTSALAATSLLVADLQTQAADQTTALKAKKAELAEMAAAAELTRSWSAIETRVTAAKEVDQLDQLKRRFRSLLRSLTDLTKEASDQLMNQNFEDLFAEECQELRAPTLKVQFVGREGRPQRRKTLSADHKPSLVLSEGEQKVIALADFLAEARLAGITAPIIFDDPVSSLDHRRVREVAERLRGLAQDNQVIVFTHDILFAATLYALSEKSGHFAYFEITDENGKGKVTRGAHPASESISTIRAEINSTIQAAKGQDGQARAALIRQGYSRIRAWCEVFAETELLQGVSRRFEPNVRMTNLEKIKVEKLPQVIGAVSSVFDDACRFTEAHSQPIATLGVAPTLEGLEADWSKLQEARKLHQED
jgi:energy-coupling factor transporter ATP-binding protein EcfA2